MPPLQVADLTAAEVVAISNEGRMLMFNIAELPQLPRGKGNKIISIPGARVADRLEFVVALAVLLPGDSLTIYSGKRHLTLRAQELEHYRGERGRRGSKLPRGFQKVDNAVANKAD